MGPISLGDFPPFFGGHEIYWGVKNWPGRGEHRNFLLFQPTFPRRCPRYFWGQGSFKVGTGFLAKGFTQSENFSPYLNQSVSLTRGLHWVRSLGPRNGDNPLGGWFPGHLSKRQGYLLFWGKPSPVSFRENKPFGGVYNPFGLSQLYFFRPLFTPGVLPRFNFSPKIWAPPSIDAYDAAFRHFFFRARCGCPTNHVSSARGGFTHFFSQHFFPHNALTGF